MNITFRIVGLENVERKLRPGIADVPINRFLTRNGMRMERNLKSFARADTGQGRRSMTNVVERRRVTAGTNLLYMEVMARGRRPGAAMPPRGALIGWMRRHGIDPSKEYALRRAIARHGIKGDDFDTKAFEASLPGIIADVPGLGREIEAAMRAG
jgi:hypothetical protein